METTPRSEQKYPADIIETVAKGMYETRLPDDVAAHEWPPSHPGDLETWTIYASAALDALGLTVTEEWAVRNERNWIIELDPCDEATARRSLEPGDSGLARRTVAHAETPWVEVTPDA